ncbi:MAG: hypothetical protein LWY06_13385 [Firmicutes bacterium]|nr:hypothetical protein [Bacillota bacterium]
MVQTNINGVKTNAFRYDHLGNRTKWEFDQSRYASAALGDVLNPSVSYDTIEYGYDSGNRIAFAGDTVFRHDDNGNMTEIITTKDGRDGDGGKASTVYGYNRAGKMFRVVNPDGSLKEYGYDASGMRIREKAADGVTREFYPDNGKIPFFGSERVSGADLPEGSNAAVSYIGEGIKPLAACVGTSTASGSANTKTVYFLDDHLGSILALTDENGNIITHYNYDEFGIMTAKREILPNPLTTQPGATGFPGYTGQYQDQTAGLLYLRNRFYNPAIGRFTQIDPIYLDNQYAYIPGGNPVNYTDVTGLRTPAGIAGGASTAFFACTGLWALHNELERARKKAEARWDKIWFGREGSYNLDHGCSPNKDIFVEEEKWKILGTDEESFSGRVKDAAIICGLGFIVGAAIAIVF